MPYFELSREFFDVAIYAVVAVGAVLAVVRLYQDFTRPLPPDAKRTTDATQPHPVHQEDDTP